MSSDILRKELGVVIVLAARAAQKAAHATQGIILSRCIVLLWQAHLMKTVGLEMSPVPGSNLQILPSQLLEPSPMRSYQPAKCHKVRYRQIQVQGRLPLLRYSLSLIVLSWT